MINLLLVYLRKHIKYVFIYLVLLIIEGIILYLGITSGTVEQLRISIYVATIVPLFVFIFTFSGIDEIY